MSIAGSFGIKKIIFYNVFLWIFIGANVYISGATSALLMLLTILLYLSFFYGFYFTIHWLYYTLKFISINGIGYLWKYNGNFELWIQEFLTPFKEHYHEKMISYGHFMNKYLYRSSISLLVIIIILGGSSFYKNEVSPTPMPRYHLSNGEKEIIFQTMSHIGSKSFYEKIRDDLREYKTQGFVYFFEGVRPGSEENVDKFNKAMGVEFDENLYKNFSKLYGVVHQDNSIYLGLVNKSDVNIDLSIDDIIAYYEETSTGEISQNHLPDEVVDISGEIIKTLSELNDRELSLLRYINKSILNFMIGSNNTQNFVLDNFSNKDLFDVILNKRDELLADALHSTDNTQIFVTYGLLHFEGVYNLLIEKDNSWKITQVENLYPITGEYFPVFGR